MKTNERLVTVTFEGEVASGKSLLITALRNFLAAVNIPFEQTGAHTIAAELSDEDRNALADFIQMRESQRPN